MTANDTSDFEKVTAADNVKEGSVQVVTVHGRKLALCRFQDKLYAIDDRCTHDNGPLGEGELIDGEIECPRHGARFDIKTGSATCLPAVGAVHTYQVEVRDGDVWIGKGPAKPQDV